MQRGGKKSPFMGRTERIESASQLLYPRYTSLSDAVLYPEGSVLPVSPPQPKAGTHSQLPQVASPAPVHVAAQPVAELNARSLFRTELQSLKPTEAVTPSDTTKPKKPKKKKQKVQEDPAAKISGPSNAEEAQLMRSVLGFAQTSQSPVTTPTAPTPRSATVPPKSQPKTQAVAAQPAAQQAQQAAAPQQAQQAQQAAAPQQAQQPHQTQQAQQAPQTQQAQQAPATQQAQAAPIQPQQQSTFRFGFAAERPAEAIPATGVPPASAAAPAVAEEAPQAAAQQALPGPPAASADPATDFVARRVFVGGMPFTYEVDGIREYWSFCGEIEDLDVMRFPDTGRFKGIAFITYATEEGYDEALKCDGTELDGQQLRVQKCMSAGKNGAKKREGQAPGLGAVDASPSVQTQQPAAPKVAGYHVAYVGNLAFEADDAEVQQLFPDCNVTKVRLHTDKATGKSRGFAHVHFLDEPSLDKAMQFNGANLHGRQVKVSYAQRKK